MDEYGAFPWVWEDLLVSVWWAFCPVSLAHRVEAAGEVVQETGTLRGGRNLSHPLKDLDYQPPNRHWTCGS